MSEESNLPAPLTHGEVAGRAEGELRPARVTANFQFPVPADTDPADVPLDIGKLADTLDALLNARLFVPGDLKPSAVATAPTGWLKCEGQAVNRAAFAALFAAIGSTYGAGDGSSTFNVPDLRGRVVIGDGTGPGLTARTNGQNGGAETHPLTIAELPSHNHALGLWGNQGPANWNQAQATNMSQWLGGSPTVDVGGNQPHNNMPPFAVIGYLIKT
jgi:microcystin-dependent protein